MLFGLFASCRSPSKTSCAQVKPSRLTTIPKRKRQDRTNLSPWLQALSLSDLGRREAGPVCGTKRHRSSQLCPLQSDPLLRLCLSRSAWHASTLDIPAGSQIKLAGELLLHLAGKNQPLLQGPGPQVAQGADRLLAGSLFGHDRLDHEVVDAFFSVLGLLDRFSYTHAAAIYRL